MGKKQSPTWDMMLAEVALARWGTPSDGSKIHMGRVKQAAEFHAGIIADAHEILKRPPELCDINQDFLELLVRKWVRRYTSFEQRKITDRVQRLKMLALYARQRFNIPAVDCDKFPLCQRDIKQQLIASAVPVPEVHPDDLPAGINPEIAQQSLSTALGQYERERLLGKSENSKRLMRVAVRKFSDWLCRDALLSDLNHDRMLCYITYLLERGDLSRGSIRTLQERLQALWRYAVSKHWLLEGPNLPLVKEPQRDPEAWRRDDMEKLLRAAKAAEGNMKGIMEDVPWSLYWSTLVLFLFDTGERIGAAIQVKYDDISSGWVTVRAEYRKGTTRDRRFKLRQCTLDGIAELRELTHPKRVKCVFEFPYTPTYLWGKFKKVLEAADLPTGRRDMFHRLRRTVASEFEAAGGSATKLLDHTHRGTTKKYLDPAVVKDPQPADIVPGIGEAPKPKADAALLAQLRNLLATTG